MIWNELGFRDNPFSTDPVPANNEGLRLLVGRNSELRRLSIAITSSNNHATIEGDNGVGKTSLVGVAAYKLFLEHQRDSTKPLYLPMPRAFQISPDEDAANFSPKFLFSLARFISENRDLIQKHHSGLRNLDNISMWLNDPIILGGGANVNVMGNGGGLNVTRSINTSSGFSQGGLDAHLREIMMTIFPSQRSGGVVCLLDNLELLDNSQKARSTLELLRDDVLSFPGVKWVLCGARGILRSTISTPRLQGKLADPIELKALSPENVTKVIETRLDIYKERDDAYTPVESGGFSRIYQIANHNLRIALGFCEAFVLWCAESDNRPENPEDKLLLIDSWFAYVAQQAMESTRDITPRAWQLFDDISKLPEGCSPSDFIEFGFNNGPAMQPHLRRLEQANLIQSASAETDRRRKMINLSPRGWIVRYYRNDYKI
ncbi:hypothetical protein T8K17_02285 [Thalassobaculum sp. OXR-137]|uniref:hypothetical protein n=1 Tax=Thalassobaculum sp. OXR-137 TaxID=3100173 RepID=UPI002AC8D907|nr:hypothetical protein [Thalassobaculum sp. OXR-137]WPZ34981.1 hypothetical protein T8K17_02285 [Thalassobaculum sp. OXR-137]